jgi:adenosylcobinamide-phosphate synthase
MSAAPAARQAGLAIAAGYLADLALADPRCLHPVAGFGWVAGRAETLLYGPDRRRGVAFAGLLVAFAGIAGELAARLADHVVGTRQAGLGRMAVLGLLTWITLGGRSLTRVAGRLADEVDAGDLDAARATVPSLCGRDPQTLDGAELTRAGVESVAENTSDAIVGALIWAAIAGPAGAAGYRAANTLDAIVGHRTPRYAEFGWASARLDDLVGFPAARLSAVLAVACAPVVGGSAAAAWAAFRRDGSSHPSPNAGRVEAAFAGALGVRLGGGLTYAGMPEVRPVIGTGRRPTTADLRRANRLSLAVGAAAALCCAVLRSLVRPRPGAGRPTSHGAPRRSRAAS